MCSYLELSGAVRRLVLSGVCARQHGVCRGGAALRYTSFSANVVQIVATRIGIGIGRAAHRRKFCFSPAPGIPLEDYLAHRLYLLQASK